MPMPFELVREATELEETMPSFPLAMSPHAKV